MSPTTRLARLGVIAAIFASAAAGATAASVSAASITFGTPKASSSFGKGVDFTQPYSGNVQLGEVDIVITYPGGFGPTLVKLDNPSAGSFTYSLDTSAGQLQPNTQLLAKFQVTLADGTVVNGPEIHVTYLDDRFTWQTKVGKVVRLHWYQGSDAFAVQALQMGEAGIAKAAKFLGFSETAPIDFYVYADQTPFYDALGPGTRDNVGGEANTETRTLFALIPPDELSYASTVVPHELTHVVFDDVTRNPYHFPPRWLNEGIAVYVSQGYGSSDKQLVSQAASDGTLMPLAAIRGEFPTTQDRFYLAYAESVSAVDYFMSNYGQADLQKLVRAFGKGASDDEAFQTAIGLSTGAFDQAWQKANGVTAQQSFGPQPAPTGPVPSGWTISGRGGATSSTPAPGSVATPASTANPAGSGSGQSPNGPPVIVYVVAAGIVLACAVVLIVAVTRRRSSGGTP
jgi:hypothetical protein